MLETSDQFNVDNTNEDYINIDGKKKKPLKKYSQVGNSILVLIILFLLFTGIVLFVKIYAKKISERKERVSAVDLSQRRFVLIGYNSVSKRVLPLILSSLKFREYLVLDLLPLQSEEMSEFKGLNLSKITIEKKYTESVLNLLKDGDVVLDLQSTQGSLETIKEGIKGKNVKYLTYGDVDPTDIGEYLRKYERDLNEKVYKLIAD